MNVIYADLETFSEADIRNGSWAYAWHKSTEVLLFGYAINDEPAKVWDWTKTKEMPADLAKAIAGGARWVFHNGFNFDVPVLRKKGFAIAFEDTIDSMVVAYQHGLVGKLADLCIIFGIPADKAKDRDGARLIRLFSVPRTDAPNGKRFMPQDKPEDWNKFVNYCRLDVEAMRVVYKKLPKWNCKLDRALQLLDQRINERGMLIDIDLAKKAVAYCVEEALELKDRTAELTDGQLDSATRRDALIKTVKEQFGVELKSARKSDIERLLETDIPEDLKELLRVRLASGRASVKKYQALLDSCNEDGRLRGGLQFRGAPRTGRWSGRRFQPQNLPRPSRTTAEIEGMIVMAKTGMLDVFYDDVGGILADCLRGAITVPDGKKMVVADYSNIEGRVLAWLAAEEWKIKAFEAYDYGTGPDLYKLTYSKAFNVDVKDVTKPQRQMGKVLELAMGYGGGVGAFVTFARGYGIDLHDMAKAVLPVIPAPVLEKAVQAYEWAAETQPGRIAGLDRNVWIACDAVKQLWRRANPHIVQFWDRVGDGARTAIREGRVVGVGRLEFDRKGTWMRIRLPGGRFICYPGIEEEEDGRMFSYMGQSQYTKKWERINTYGPKLVENIVQATACDLLGEALPRLEMAGFLPVLTIHDEVLTEAPDRPEFNHERMETLMATNPKWADGLPLAAAGFESKRYHK